MPDRHRVTYKATNIIDGEVLEGSVAYLARKLKVSIDRIYQASSSATVVAEMWEVSKETSECEPSSGSKYNFPYDLLQEWDRVTKPFKVLSRRRAARVN